MKADPEFIRIITTSSNMIGVECMRRPCPWVMTFTPFLPLSRIITTYADHACKGVAVVECRWSSDRGPMMPELTDDEKWTLLSLMGYGYSGEWDMERRLIREAYRRGWEAAQRSHDEFVDGK